MNWSQYRHHCTWLQTLRIREDTVVSSVFQLGVSMLLTTVSFLLLFGFGTNCRLLLLCPLPSRHSGLDYRHFGDSDVNLDTFILFYVHFLARFYRPEICRLLPQRFMHICHARHYSTLKKVHYWKRDTHTIKSTAESVLYLLWRTVDYRPNHATEKTNNRWKRRNYMYDAHVCYTNKELQASTTTL